MKIVLINPRNDPAFPQPPLGLLHIASAVREWASGWTVDLIDCNALDLDFEACIRTIDHSADVIGISAMTPNVLEASRIFDDIKARWPEMPTILGGPHITTIPEQTMNVCSSVDYGVLSEGEETVPELLDAIMGHHLTLDKVDGIVYRDHLTGELKLNKARKHIKNLDRLPYPAYDLLPQPLTLYRPYPPHGRSLPYMTMVTTRGCPYNCSFCSKNVWGKVYNVFSADYVIKHVKHLQDEFGVQYIQFYDDSFTVHPKRIAEICKGIEPLKITWSCETRVNLVNYEMLKQMKKGGCLLIGFGIESGVQRILDLLTKGIKLQETRKAIELCDKIGIETSGYMMMGNPTETREEIQQSVDFVKSIPLNYVQWSICTPYLGTQLYKDAMKAGTVLPENWDEWVYVSLQALKEEKTPMILATDRFTSEELIEIQRKAYQQFYFSLPYIWRRLKKCTSWTGIKTNIRGLRLLRGMLS